MLLLAIVWLLSFSIAEAALINGSFTLTAYAPDDAKLNGLKVNYGGGLNLFQEKVRQYCPQPPVTSCPNGTDTVWYNGLFPSSMVPGGQDTYVLASGLVLITPQHSHSKPADAYWAYEGWSCSAPAPEPACSACPTGDPLYDCRPAAGLCTWKLPTQEVGGVLACANPYNANVTSVFARTPGFNQTGCVELEGLTAHAYHGSIPVWSYI